MGRYYSGDIEGKFWFGVQSSDDAGFFGVQECEPSEINYCAEKEDLPKIEKGLAKCKKELGEYGAKLEEFFKREDSYNDEMVAEYLKVPKKEVGNLLAWFARQELGQKIYDCVKEKGYCSFSAEL